MRIPPWIERLQEQFAIYLPLIYFAYALPITVAFALINPPFMVPDEVNHFYRTVQISDGHLFASRSPDPAATLNNTSGGTISSNAVEMGKRPVFIRMAFNILEPFDPATARHEHLFDIPWGDKKEFMSFPNTAPYPFTSYLPAAIGMAVSRMAGLDILESLLTARLCNAFTCVIFSALAIHFASRGKLILICLLSMPMTIFLFSSLSQDALIIAYLALAIGLLNRYLNSQNEQRTVWGFGFIFLFLALSIIGRLPYLPILFIASVLIVVTTKSFKWTAIGFCAACGAIAGFLHSIRYLGISIAKDADPHRQAVFILHHPVKFLGLMTSTIQATFYDVSREFIGVLGWLNYFLPEPFYAAIGIVLGLALIFDFRAFDSKLPGWSRVITALFALSSAVLILIGLFSLWGNESTTLIDGQQGRYYLPAAMMLTLAAGNRDLSWMTSSPFRMVRFVASVAVLSVMILSDFNALLACLARYYY
jgi:uncharacterized membrane protein